MSAIDSLRETLPYRPCVGVVLLNHAGLVWTGERVDTPGAWQMPQGGIDPGETREEAGLRELEEEIGVRAGQVSVLSWLEEKVRYDLPDNLLGEGRVWGGKFRGQEQDWCLCRLETGDEAININTSHPEFARWRWATSHQLVQDIVPFKKEVYQKIVNAFGL